MLRFCPLKCLKSVKDVTEKLVVIVLNKDIVTEDADPIFRELWKKSVYRACTDGGANFVYDVRGKSTNGISSIVPDLVSGDFDSIRPEVKEFYENQSRTEVIHTPDQDETDFTKCTRLVADKMRGKDLDANLIVALGGKQDRFDHSMANIQTLYKAQNVLPHGVHICLVYGASYICLLPKGKSVIEVDTGLEGSWCGLLPVGQPVTVTTTGLKWNLTNDKLQFGELVSTSNELDGSKEVTIETDHPLVWTLAHNIVT